MVTNHSLLAVDMLAGRHIVPPHKLLIIDEAHELADRVSSAAQAELVPELIDRAARRARPLLRPETAERADRGRRRARRRAGRGAGRAAHRRAARRRCAEACTLLDAATRAALDAIGDVKSDDPDPVRKQQAKAVLDELSTTAQRLLEEADHDVAWVEKSDSGNGRRALVVAPLSVAGTLATHLYDERTVVATSATLALGGRFDTVARSLGLDAPPPAPAPSPTAAALADATAAGRRLRPPGRASSSAAHRRLGGGGAGHRRAGLALDWTSVRRSTTPGRASSTSPRTCPGPASPGCPTAAGEELLALVERARRSYPRALLLPAGRAAGRGAGAGADRPAGAAPGRGGAAAAGPPVPRGACQLPVRGDVALAGGGRAGRRLPARGDRPAALPAARRAAGGGARGGGGRRRRLRLRGGQRADRRGPAGPGRRPADPRHRRPGGGRGARLPAGDGPRLRAVPAPRAAARSGTPPGPRWPGAHWNGSPRADRGCTAAAGRPRRRSGSTISRIRRGCDDHRVRWGVGTWCAASRRTAVFSTAISGTATSAPTMPASTTPAAMPMITASGMDGDRPAHDQRLQDVPLDLLHTDHHTEDDQRGDRAAVDERDQHRHRRRRASHRRSG